MQKDDVHVVWATSNVIYGQDCRVKLSMRQPILMDAGIWCETYTEAHCLCISVYGH